MRTVLQQACNQGEIRLLDLYIGLFLEGLLETTDGHAELLLAGTLASAAVGHGNVCQPLNRVSELPLQLDQSLLPDPEKWRKSLLATPVVGHPGETTPLILDPENRLYLYRYFQYEKQIAHNLLQRADGIEEINIPRARDLLTQLFSPAQQPDFQQLAAALALLKRLLVISGGPGTGKTYTVARILALIQALKEKPLRIALAAPTGKAAARLEESIRKARAELPLELAERIPEQAQTLHRLLGYRPGAVDFRHTCTNPLHFDLVVLDEASMIDVVLMNGLVRALPDRAGLILLGDHNQLASVEAGSLFGDLCAGDARSWSPEIRELLHQLTGTEELPISEAPSTMTDSVILLRTSHRFKDTSGIGSLAQAVNNGAQDQVTTVLQASFPDLIVFWTTGRERERWLRKEIIAGFQAMCTASTVEQAFSAMEQFRFLCAIRKGDAGVEGINSLAEQVLRTSGYISGDTEWYQGKPVIIRRNQYEMQLYNGDTGILWKDSEGQLRAWFKRPDNKLYPVTPARLPDHDPAYAITIHKAQGSEFDQVLLLLPEEENAILSRELLYTGITRARNRLTLCCNEKILHSAVARRTMRHTGLKDMLWAGEAPA